MSFSIVFLVFITYSNRARNTLKTFEKWGLASILVFVRRGNVPERASFFRSSCGAAYSVHTEAWCFVLPWPLRLVWER